MTKFCLAQQKYPKDLLEIVIVLTKLIFGSRCFYYNGCSQFKLEKQMFQQLNLLIKMAQIA